MIRLNEKGFAVSTILYGILTLTILILMLIFGIMKSSKDMNEGLIESLTASMNKCVFYEVKLENCYIDGNSDCQTFIDEYKSCVATKNESNNTDEENPIVYKINVSSNNTSYGTVSVTNPTVIHGETAYITFSPNSGYVYDSNTCGGTLMGSLENTLRIPNVTKDIECTVTFKPSMHTVRVSVTNGKTETASTTVSSGGSVTIALTSENYNYKYYSYTKTGSASVSVSDVPTTPLVTDYTLTISNVASDVSVNVKFDTTNSSGGTTTCTCPNGGTLQSDNTCDITTTSSTSSCKWCNVTNTKEYRCPKEDEWCPPPTPDHYGHHSCDFPGYNGGVISYECYWYDETEYIQSCSDCGSTSSWTCSFGSLTYDGSSYGICTYNATC